MIKIEISNKAVYTLISIFALISLGVGVYAVQQASSGGTHSWNEIGMPSCNEGQVLKWSSGNWVCGNPETLTEAQVDAYVSNNGYLTSSSLSGYVTSSSLSSYLSSSSIQIVSKSATSSYTSVNEKVSCPSGKKLIGGGCWCSIEYPYTTRNGKIRSSYPLTESTYKCECADTNYMTVFAICI